MPWILFALAAHLGNALVFVVDKSLLGSQRGIGQPLQYAFYSALLAGAAIVLLPFAWIPPSSFILSWSVLAGLARIGALLFFFSALKASEPSRVVPITGSVVPLFTLLLAVVVLGEALAGRQLLAVALLIIGGTVLASRLVSRQSLILAVSAGALFATNFVTMKFIFDGSDSFLSTFAYSRVIEALLAFVILGPLVWLKGLARGVDRKVGRRRVNLVIPTFFVGNKTLAAGAFLLQNYAISLGSVTVVNALQGTQYFFVLLLAVMISRWWPKLFEEELRRVTMAQKVAGITLVSIGLALLL